VVVPISLIHLVNRLISLHLLRVVLWNRDHIQVCRWEILLNLLLLGRWRTHHTIVIYLLVAHDDVAALLPGLSF
jgi:hypothetical protein